MVLGSHGPQHVHGMGRNLMKRILFLLSVIAVMVLPMAGVSLLVSTVTAVMAFASKVISTLTSPMPLATAE